MKTITLHDNATKVISNMQDRVEEIGTRYGEHSPEHAKAAASLSRALTGLMLSGFSDTAEVSRDGDLSLYVTEGAFAYGIIFHGDRAATDQILAKHGQSRDTTNAHVIDLYDIAGSWTTHS